MGGYDDTAGVDLQDCGRKFTRVQRDERTSIPSKLRSNALQEPAYFFHRSEARHVYQQVHAATLARMFEDAGEFGTEDEVGVLVGKEVARSGLQSLLQMGAPDGVREVSGGQQMDALAPRPMG